MPNPSGTYRRPKQPYAHKTPLTREDFAAHVGKKVTAIAAQNNWPEETCKVAIALINHLVHDKPKPSVPSRDFSTNQITLVHDAYFESFTDLGDGAKHLKMIAAASNWFRKRYREYAENKKKVA